MLDIFTPDRKYDAGDIDVPEGYTVELVAQGLTFPTAATVDDEGNLYVVESGFAYEPEWERARLLRVNEDGSLTTIYDESKKTGPWTGLVFHDGYFYITDGNHDEGGRILKISPEGRRQILVDNLPSLGDHHTNGPVIGPDGKLYFGQGTATNSGVVGVDNWKMGWLTEKEDFHDIPCDDIKLKGKNYRTGDPLSNLNPKDVAVTGAFSPFKNSTEDGQLIPGQIPCSGAIMRIPTTGGPAELVAWGFRNPYGLAFDAKGDLYVTENGFDARGSRPVVGALDHLWKVEEGGWYGWPDYAGGVRLDDPRFARPGEQTPALLLAEYPATPPRPVADFGLHSSSNGIAFATNMAFGEESTAYVAQFGDMTPLTGKTTSPVGYKVVRVDVRTGKVEDFAVNKNNLPASRQGRGGLERPVGVTFSPDGQSLYIVDFGILNATPVGPLPEQESGCIWKVSYNAETSR